MSGDSIGEGPEGGSSDPSQQLEGPALRAHENGRPGQAAFEGSQGSSSRAMPSQQQQPPPSPFLQRAMHPASSSSTSGSSCSPENTTRSRLPTLPETEVSDGSWLLGLGAAALKRPPLPAKAAANVPPPQQPQPPASARLPSAALLSGASSISIASPFMQSQIAFSAMDSEGSARWRSGAFTPLNGIPRDADAANTPAADAAEAAGQPPQAEQPEPEAQSPEAAAALPSAPTAAAPEAEAAEAVAAGRGEALVPSAAPHMPAARLGTPADRKSVV